ncbi:tyrosine--tRNA ligase, chloroplastic/mitochondrial-like [Iris pallida]|uniref:Tyrosine--tRNA ligase, chloroplastic/mitochondrial-like n=1 Tax=Iris pallida TaxID=29817 RepID=A0AAX6G5U0_IRIPA|nr:tyrosine--tRNA ligase, chloroplastic/mitochondrial-like [Iris pallida]
MFLSMEEIRGIEEGMGRPGYVPNSAQRRLAEEVTRGRAGRGVDERPEAGGGDAAGLEDGRGDRGGRAVVLLGLRSGAEFFSGRFVVVDGVSREQVGCSAAGKARGLYLNNRRIDSYEKTNRRSRRMTLLMGTCCCYLPERRIRWL